MTSTVAPTELDPAAAVASIAGACLDGYRPEIHAVDGRPHGWASLSDLASEPARRQRHAAIEAAAGARLPDRVSLVWEVEAVAWFVGAVVAGPLIARGELLELSPDTTWVRIGGEGVAEAIAVDSESPSVSRQDLGSHAALVAKARTITGKLLEPVIEGRPRPASRSLWWNAGDRIADSALWYGAALAKRQLALTLAADLISPGVPWSVPLGINAAGLLGDAPVRARRTCCLSRRVAGGEACSGCPLGL